ncbi:peptidylprolyl isomerase [Sinanaerobacter chloroacetimidivorans]|jgi:foldase protein PrsA|uniref:peptidylprolyl isomerase n=1 Tax=Sinanaerobacter chloroacetimidivorans TaxID=2818044 RepID=A0A8J7W7G9_9FIRM|nr:peptidylprolyl isomerase [Sinanaerobacter chloroacetimidivorans]MBR0600438.1 peptidylprolyl isomerase [Sinanaerobacter chloroacetimidivorans]
MKKYAAMILAIILVFSFAACGDKAGTDLAKVGDEVITSSELDQYVELYAFVQGMDLTQITDEKSMKYIKSLMLEDMISMEAMKQHFAGKEDEVLPETVDEDLQKFIDDSKAEEAVKSFLEEKKITDEALTRFYLSQYYTTAYFDEIEAGMPNLEADAKAYYEENKDSFAVDEVTASHILVDNEELAKEILDKIKAGAKFEDMAKEYGTDGTKDTGGSLGTFGRGKMVKEFEDAAFALEPGQLSDVVKTEWGYHIIKVTDKNQGIKTYDEVAESVKATLVSQESEGKIKELRDSIGVEYLTKEYTGEIKES